MVKLRFEQVGDINTTYNYIQVFVANDTQPFMEISISEDKVLSFVIFFEYYNDNIYLSLENWLEIYEMANSFYPNAIKNGDALKE